MDDLDHSVLIAEQDWNYFYEQTEECCLLQVELASLDDSGLSDNEDASSACPVPNTAQLVQSSHDQPEAGEEGYLNNTTLQPHICQSDTEANKSGDPPSSTGEGGAKKGRSRVSDNTHEPEGEVETEKYNFITTSPLVATSTCPASTTKSIGVNNSNPGGGKPTCSISKDHREQGEGSLREDKKGIAIVASYLPQTSSPCDQHTRQKTSLEKQDGTETAAWLEESYAVPRKEKERWFVTVNDNPAQLRVNAGTSVQKKRRKKKSSKISAKWDRRLVGQCPPCQSDSEAESCGIDESKGHKITKKTAHTHQRFSELPYINTFPENIQRELLLELLNINQFVLSSGQTLVNEEVNPEKLSISKCQSVTGWSVTERKCENSSSEEFQDLGNIGITQDNKAKINNVRMRKSSSPTDSTLNASENLLSSTIPRYSPQLQSTNLNCPMPPPNNHQSTAGQAYNYPTKTLQITSQSENINANLRLIESDTGFDNSQGFRRTSAPIRPADKLPPEHVLSSQSDSEGDPPSAPQETESQESLTESTEALDEALGPTRPIYAISSFWDEMEKLTINDILELRVAHNRSPQRETINLQGNPPIKVSDDSGLVDSKDACLQDSVLVDDPADSGYFTHLDDSKPDRLSCEFSTFSDFDEEFLQILNASANPSPEPQDIKEHTQEFLKSTCMKGLLVEQELDPPEELTMLCSKDGIPLCRCSDVESKSTLVSTYQESKMNPFLVDSKNIRKTSPSPILPSGDILDEHFVIPLPEMFEDDSGEEPQATLLDRPSLVVSLHYSQNLSVPETYDYFFSESEVGNLFFPLIQKKEDEPVPIVSCSRSVVRDQAFPEVEELMESESEDEYAPIRVMTRFNSLPKEPASTLAAPDVHLFTGQRRNWKSALSFRRTQFTGKGRSWCRRASSWVFPGVAKRADRPFKTIDCASVTARAGPTPQVFHLENQVFQEFAEQQRHFTDPQNTVSISKKDGFLFSLKQSDMCLVCIAFASWILKSANPQSSETWKAALLANVSAISAIQYLRLYVKEDTTRDEP